jgi:hypothetical protein|tara:strand:- start:2277 stop:2621 length:345 start_codon:yes stop_codon:yes gene_type:complete
MVQKPKPKILITHVLAVTEKGDTLRLPIDMIKPNVYYNVINYGRNYWRPYYNGYYHYDPTWNNNRPIYVPNNNSNNSNNSNNNTNNTPVIKPSPNNVVIPPKPVNPRGKKGGND